MQVRHIAGALGAEIAVHGVRRWAPCSWLTRTREDRIKEQGGSGRDYVAEHPVVRPHPETGRKALYVNVGHTVRFRGMTEINKS